MVQLAFIYSALAACAMFLWQTIGTTIYDYHVAREHAQQRQHPHIRRYRERPLVSVVIVLPPQGEGIEKTLASLRHSSYRKIEVVIMAYGVNRMQAAAQRQSYAAVHAHVVRYHFTQTKRQAYAVHNTIRRHTHGVYIVILEAGQLLQPASITRAVHELQAHPEVSVLIPHLRVHTALRFTHLTEAYIHLLRWRLQKADTTMGVLFTDRLTRIIRRSGELQRPVGPHVRYANTVIITTPGTYSIVQSQVAHYRTQLMRGYHIYKLARTQPIHSWHLWIRLLLSTTTGLLLLGLPILFTYCAFVAVVTAQPIMLFVLLSLLSLPIIFAILDEPDMRFLDKLIRTLGIPLMYGVFALLGFLQYFVVAGIAVYLLAQALQRYLLQGIRGLLLHKKSLAANRI